MEYQEFLDYIYQRHSGNVKLGLGRMHNILISMGSPNKKLHGIHIAGTNGKGSTAAICEALSINYGMKTGLNTSPHLVDYRERIRLNGNDIGLNELISTYKKWESILEKYEASFFEITTAMAFDIFHSHKIDNAIFEVGLGGRLDGTNPFTSTVSVITTISFDHTKSLGDSIKKIAYEKAGIIKQNTPVILGDIVEEAKEVIKKRALEMNAPLIEYGKDYYISDIQVNEHGTSFNYVSHQLNLKNVSVNLLGKHQAYNAATAITAFTEFLKRMNKKINTQNIYQALSNVNWQGRMQIISRKPTVIIDGAHNEEGIRALKNNLTEIFPHKKIFFVLAILRDKNLEKIIKDICSVSYKIYITKNKSARAAEIEDQVNFVKRSKNPYEIHEDVMTATKKAISDAGINDIVMISGSLYTISEVIKEKTSILNK